MADLMIGLGLGMIGFIIFFMADIFVKYPASANAPPPWPYLTVRAVAIILFGVGVIFLILSFL